MTGMSHLENLTVAEIAKQHADVVAGIRQCDPIQTMAIFAGLLSQPDLQANCDRLETPASPKLHLRGRRRCA